MQSRPCGLLRGIIGRGLRPVKVVAHSGIDNSIEELNKFGKADLSHASIFLVGLGTEMPPRLTRAIAETKMIGNFLSTEGSYAPVRIPLYGLR